MPYIPTPGPLPGVQFVPYGSNEGCAFLDAHCANCARDKAIREGLEIDECDENELCEILAASFRGEAVEWRIVDEDTPTERTLCTSFVPVGQPIPTPRCEGTVDMFGGAP